MLINKVMNRAKFLNLLQLKIIEEHYAVSSLYQPKEFGEAFLIFVSKGGPKILREALDKLEYEIGCYLDESRDYSHQELCEIKEELELYEEIKYL